MKIKLLSTFLFASVALFAQHNETKKIIKIQGNDTTVIMINGRIDKMDSLLTEEMKTIYLNDSAKQVEINQLQKSLTLAEYIKSAQYISKEDAADFMKGEYGEDFLDDVGYNPLQNSIDVNLKADFVTAQRLDSISEVTLNKKFVDDVRYDKDLVSIMNSNVKRISFWVLIISALFTLIAVLLINSSIRLAVYAKRFTIKTMQMVGATKQFIRRPFVLRSIKLGIIGAAIALIGMAIVLYYINKTFPELNLLRDQILLISLFVGIFLIGIFPPTHLFSMENFLI